MTRFDDDRELEDFLARRSALHRRALDADPAEPPAELDRLVLDRARAAIQTPRDVPVYRAPRWALPVSLAATVVLALAIVVNYGRVQHGAVPVSSPTADAAAPERAGAPAQIAPAAPPAPAPAPELVAKSVQSFDGGSARAPAVPEQAPLTASTRNAHAMRPSAEMQAIAPARRAVAAQGASSDRIAEVRLRDLPRQKFSETLAATTETAAAERLTAPAPSSPAPAAAHTNPQAWLREIEGLRQAGRSAEADRELAEFRKAFPTIAVPAVARDPRPAQ